MSGTPNITTEVVQGGLGIREENVWGITGMIFSATDTYGGIAHGEVKGPLKALSDAEGIGITKDNDLDEVVLIWHHVKEFFRLNENGELWVMLTDQDVTLTNMLDKDNDLARKLVIESDGRVKLVGAIMNPEAPYTPTITNGVDGDVLTAVAKATLLRAYLLGEGYDGVHFIIEGKSFSGIPGDIKDNRTLAAEGVGCVLYQDWNVAELDGLFNSYAAVGNFLGILSKAPVSDSPGWLKKYPISSVPDAAMQRVALSSHTEIRTFTRSQLNLIHNRGWIIAISFTGKDGFYTAGAPACVSLGSDFNYLERSRTMDKVRSLTRAVLLDYLGAPLKADPDTGQLSRESCSDIEGVTDKALDEMLRAEEITARKAYVNPAQDVITTGVLQVRVSAVPMGVAREITLQIGFTITLS